MQKCVHVWSSHSKDEKRLNFQQDSDPEHTSDSDLFKIGKIFWNGLQGQSNGLQTILKIVSDLEMLCEGGREGDKNQAK